MARKPKRSRSADLSSIPLRRRLISFLLDWFIWGYIAYGAVYLLNYYWYTVYIDWYGRLTLPPWGWPLVIGATFELALLCRACGHSLGLRILGLTLTSDSAEGEGEGEGRGGGLPLSWGRRLRYFLAGHISILPLGIGIWASPDRPWHERLSGVGLVRLPDREELTLTAPPPPWYRTNWGLMALVVLGLTVALGWHITAINLQVLFSEAGKPARLWQGLVTPDFSYLVRPDPWLRDSITGALIESVFMALLATVFGAVIAFILSFFGARNIMTGSLPGMAVYGLMRGFFNIFRSIESILWALIFAVWVGWGPFAGTLALFLHTIAALGKLYSEQVEHIDPGPLEAVTAAGASFLETIRYAVIPQILPPFLAFTLYRWDINVRMATVVALVGGGGIGRLFFYYKNERDWPKVGAVIVAIALVVWALDYISARVREKIV